MEIKLDLSKHCIETEIRMSYNRAISKYFTSKKDRKNIERILDATLHALENFDFSKLRSKYPALAGDTDHEVVLSKEGDRFVVFIDGEKIEPDTKK